MQIMLFYVKNQETERFYRHLFVSLTFSIEPLLCICCCTLRAALMLSHATACENHGKGKAKTSQNMSERVRTTKMQDLSRSHENVVCKFGILPSILPDGNSRNLFEDDRRRADAHGVRTHLHCFKGKKTSPLSLSHSADLSCSSPQPGVAFTSRWVCPKIRHMMAHDSRRHTRKL